MSDLTPVHIEQKLTALVTEITRAQQDLASARNAETDALVAHKRATLEAAFSPACPVPSRQTGVTVDMRESWIENRTVDEWEALQRAETARETGQDRLRALLAVASTVQSLSRSVTAAYATAGAS